MAVAGYPIGPPRPKTEQLLIRTSGACRYFKVGDTEVRAVDVVTWEVPQGKLYALRGRSGSGKTTLLNLIGALDKPTDGQVFFEDSDLGKLADGDLTKLRRHRMGFVFQTFALLPVLSAYENVELSMRIAGAGPRERRDRSVEVLEMVGLGPRMNHRPFELSGGEQQRVSIARAIVNRPSLLIADEPTGELDSVTGFEIMMLFRSIVDDEGITLVMATHDPALSQFADETFLMEDGRLSRPEGPLDFDLPDLVQHIEIVRREGAREEAHEVAKVEVPPPDLRTRNEPEVAAPQANPPPEAETDHSPFKRRR